MPRSLVATHVNARIYGILRSQVVVVMTGEGIRGGAAAWKAFTGPGVRGRRAYRNAAVNHGTATVEL